MADSAVPGSRRLPLWVIAFLAIACGSALGEERLPGDTVPLAESFELSGGFLARCAAVDDPAWIAQAEGTSRIAQRFRVLELIDGSTHGEAFGRIEYSCLPGERPIRREEVVLWFGRIGADGTWLGTKALLDNADNRNDAARAVDRFLYDHRPFKVYVRVEHPKRVYTPDEPIPVQLEFSRDEPGSGVVWADPAADCFEIITDDGEPLQRIGVSEQLDEEPTPLVIGPYQSEMIRDLAGRYDWLAGRDMRTFTLVWRGMVRIGDRDAAPFEAVSFSDHFVVRDPTRLSWGEPSQGLACGLAAVRDTVAQGDELEVHLGLRFDPGSAAASLGVLNDFSREVGVTFTNLHTGVSIPRGRRVVHGPGPPSASRDDIVTLRECPVSLRPVDIPLLTPEGEQLPEGSYSVTAWYENEGTPEMIAGTGSCSCCSTVPYVGPWTFWKGRITSAPIRIHVRQAEPMLQELRVNSGFVIEARRGRTCWGLSQEHPLRARITKRSGFFVGRKDDMFVAIGEDDFRPVGQHRGPTWNPGGGCTYSLTPEDEARLAAGEPVAIRADITIFESSNPPGHRWRPEHGDYRILWQGRIEGGLPSALDR